MQLTDMLQQLGGLQSMARELGVSEQQAAAGAEALIPAILGGFKQQAQAQPAGLDGLGGLLQQLGAGLSALLEMNRDGDPLDDILRVASAALDPSRRAG